MSLKAEIEELTQLIEPILKQMIKMELKQLKAPVSYKDYSKGSKITINEPQKLTITRAK